MIEPVISPDRSERSGLMTGSIIDFDQNVVGTQA